MADFILGINVTFPLFFMLFTGYILKRINIIDEKFINQATNLIFYVTMPLSLVVDVKNSDLSNVNLEYILYLLTGVMLMFGVTWFFARFFIKERDKLSAFVHCAYRSNFLYIGMPILKAIKPDYDMAPVLAAMIFGIALFNVLGIVILTFYSDHSVVISELIMKILKNPIIISMIVGIVFKLIHFPLPNILERSFKELAHINTPLALIMIGGSLKFKMRTSDIVMVGSSAFIKNVLGAAILVPIAYMMGFTSSEIVVAYILFATPCAINCFVMGKKLGSNELLTSQIITVSYLMSIVTFTIGIAILHNFNIV